MNKVLKGLVAVTASAAMAVAGLAGVAGSAMAVDNTVNVTVPDTTNLKNHTYTAYQILTGSQAESGGALGSTNWGNGIDSAQFLAALKADETIGSYFANVTTSDQFVKVLGAADVFASNGANTNIVAKIALANKTGDGTALMAGPNALATGYYLIVDSTTEGNQTVYNPAVLAITSDIAITDKTSVPTLEKKVQENKKGVTGGYGSGFNDVADYNIGDDVPFHLIGSVPDMSQYETYVYKFSDTLGAGFDAPAKVKVYLSSDKVLDQNDTDVTTDFTVSNVTTGTDNTKSFTVSTKNLKSVNGGTITAGQYIIVDYTAKLTGDTTEDKVIVFTYKLDTTKVDSDNAATKLQGAEFKLRNADNQYAVVDANNKVTSWSATEEGGSTLTSDANGLFSVTGLDDGTYSLKETKAPAGYNLPARDFRVEISATTANGQNWDETATHALTMIDVTVDGTAGTGNVQTGTAAIVIKNTKGSSLPSTGGMGTTILYAAGAAIVLVAAFGIAFAVRRRNAR